MREILFRGKRVDNGAWVYGGIVHQTDYYGYKVDKWFIIDGTTTYEVIPETVGQYTGLTANGKKMFEGDIVEFKSKNYSKALSCRRIVTFGSGCFLLKNIKTGVHTNFIMYQREYCVIGNIHDNPELLGGEKCN